jgi:endonuclease YncB( thermonuclease family)
MSNAYLRVSVSLPLAALFAFLLFVSPPCQALTLVGKVVGVSDGDTIKVLDAKRVTHVVRLSGIDAPEKRQAFGSVSKASLARLVAGKTVKVGYRKKDRYQRILGQVTVDGHDANLAQVRAGLAWHYTQYQKEQALPERVSYRHAEQQARTGKIGLWRDARPVAPWTFRRMPRR